MKRLISIPTFGSVQQDAASGVVVFLVALPLCLGIALASGAPILSGLIAGAIGGLVVSILSGSELSVSGPAAGLASVVVAGIASLGGYENFLAAVVIAGVLQVVLGLLRAGSVAEFVPNSVIRGMLAGIGVVIIHKQIGHLIGWDASPDMDEQSSLLLGGNFLADWLPEGAAVSMGALLIGLVCLLILVAWELPAIKKQSWSKLVPGSLVAVVVGTALNELLLTMGIPWAVMHGSNHMVQIPLISSGATLVTLPNFTVLFANPKVWLTAVTITIIASIETLLCIEATDKLDPQKRISDTSRELVAQGIGNSLSGLIGGLPITSVIVRSSTNVYTGARTRLSALIHGILILAAVLLIPEFLNRIPLTCLAAVLIMVGYKLTSLQIIRESWEHGIDQFLPFGVTVLGVVFTDLLIGIGLGFAASLFWVLKANRFAAISVSTEADRWTVSFNKDASFVTKSELKRTLQKIPDKVHVTFDATRASVIDHDIYDTIGEFAQAATYRSINIEYINVFGKRKSQQ
jgi:MFS superfamily sulfate permease-like transporter